MGKYLLRSIKRKKDMVAKVMRNEEYVAAKQKRELTAKNKVEERKLKRRTKRTQKSLEKAEKKKFRANHAEDLDASAQARVARLSVLAKKAGAKDTKANTAEIRARAVVHKYIGELKQAKIDIETSSNTLEHMEEHEEEARVVNK